MVEIVDDEIANTQAMVDLLRGRLHNFLYIASVEGVRSEKWPQFLEQLGARIELMRRHREDKVTPLS